MVSALFTPLVFASLVLATSSNSTATSCPSCDATACSSRSIWSLLASCGLTLLICVWHALYPALPLPHWKWYNVVIARFCFMLVAFIAPEFTIAFAVAELSKAKEVTKKVHDSGHRWWTRTHSHFILNGGFVLRDNTGLREIEVNEFLQLLDAKEIMNPVITEPDIEDKSSSDVLAKTILIVQLSWFMIQIVVRLVNHLAVTLIELDTVCMALLTLPLIFCWWKKPFCAARPHTFYKRNTSARGDLSAVSAQHNELEKLLPGEILTITTKRDEAGFLFPATEDSFVSLSLTWMIFGASHLVAWNYGFQTGSEKILWRVASLALAGSPVFLQLGRIIKNVHEKLLGIYLFLVTIIGITSRLLLVALMLASLRSLPSSAYQIIPWTTYIPHL